jgi:hypothetical protein
MNSSASKHWFFSLKGWDKTAQPQHGEREKRERTLVPRALPWAILSQPFRLKNERTQKHFWHHLFDKISITHTKHQATY